MENWQLLEKTGINLRGKKNGIIKIVCPKCSHLRKKKNDPCLSVNIDEGTYNCWNDGCEFHGKVYHQPKKENYVLPPKRLEKLEKETIEYFENHRKISNNTLLRFKITDSVEWMPAAGKEIPVICFNYFRNDILINTKYRGKNKDFKLIKNAELIFYNLDAIKDQKECIICEGEIDCLALYEAGFYNVVSVPNGASRGAQKLEYLDNCWQYFEDKEKIILMTDGDEPGIALRDELARRLGKEKCLKINYPKDCKDANEILIKHGKEALSTLVNSAIEFPIEGVLTIGEDLIEDIYKFWEQGYPAGKKVGIQGLDELISFQEGQFTMITGIPGSGKSEFLDYILAADIINNGNRWGICSFENQPSSLHATKIMQKLSGKSFAFRHNSEDRMSQAQFERVLVKAHDHVTFVNIHKVDTTMKGILEKAYELVKRKGITRFIIDPWNYIEHNRPNGMSETEYVSVCLTELKVFCIKTDCHVFLVAHPTKLKKENGKYEIATLYSISGSAHFFNKTDNGISIYRDAETNEVVVYVQKVRFDWNGKLGSCAFTLNKETRQYEPNPF